MIKAGRRFGKTVVAARIAVEAFLAGRRVLYAAPTAEQTAKFWSEVNWCLAEPVKAGIFKKNESERYIEKEGTDQRIKAKTAWNVDTLRGDFADVLILDEWQLMNEEAWTVVGLPMLLDNNGDAVFIFTPPSLKSRSISKATDPRHASKMFKEKMAEMKKVLAEGREPRWFVMHGTSLDNPTLPREALDEIATEMSDLAYRQEILAEETDEAPGSLWKRKTIEASRIKQVRKLDRVVVGVDPPGGSTECGIVCAGVGMCDCKGPGKEELHGFVIADESMLGPPNEWAEAVSSTYKTHEADRVVAERNFGGDMVENTVRTADANIPFKEVHASRGKAVRAEPIAALSEKGKIHFVGVFPKLEDELCEWVPGTTSYSPNRLDAMVWALTELMVKRGGLYF